MILITGGTGLIGKHLTKLLFNKGYHVAHLSRSPGKDPAVKTFIWDLKKGTVDKEAIASADYIIHLAGATIAGKRWTAERKKELVNSRTETAKLLYANLTQEARLKAFISASGIGYYGAVTTDHIFKETDTAGNDFVAECCIHWEKSTDRFATKGIRTVKFRFGVVLSDKGGALPKIASPIKLFAGAPLGSGKQYFPWIHIDDACAMIINAITHENMQGVYNAVAPEHINNKQFVKAIAAVLNRPLFLPHVPGFVLKAALGEMAAVLLEGSRASPAKIISEGFEFKYRELKKALEDLEYGIWHS